MSSVKREIDDEWEMISNTSGATGSAHDAADTMQSLETVALEGVENPQSNPIGDLQERCIRTHLPAPEYRNEYSTGPPHIRTFGITCSVGTKNTMGVASSKKTAKKSAASKMLILLQENPEGEFSAVGDPTVQVIENALNNIIIGGKSGTDVQEQLDVLARQVGVEIEFIAKSDIEGRSVCICKLGDYSISGIGQHPESAKADAAAGALQHLKMIHAA